MRSESRPPLFPAFLERLRAVAFDLDGTLVDSAPDLAAAANAMLAALGHRTLREDRVCAAIGDGIDALVARTLAESTGAPPEPDALVRAAQLFREIYARRVFESSTVYAGVREGLEALAGRGLPLGCITNKAGRFTQALLEQAGLARWLSFVECADALEQRKPAPFLLLKACGDLGIEPRELLFVGDSALDVAAARAAGCPVVLVAYGYNRGRPATEAGADAVIGDIRELAATA
ncbi:MAG TPA: phosphoglycolate phosphatase [Usitatibacter sp.]|nr:phosphoglycolate phosphatase [Usitatibacter sp.]